MSNRGNITTTKELKAGEEKGEMQTAAKSRRGRKAGAIYFPRNDLIDATRVPKVIWEKNAGNPFTILDIAEKLNYSATSSTFAELLRSSQRYGLTEGSWTQMVTKKISLTPLGKSIVAPKIGEDANVLLRQALETPEIFRKVFSLFDGKIIPPEDVVKNTLIRDFNLSKRDVNPFYNVMTRNITELKLSQEVQGKIYLRLDRLSASMLAKPISDIKKEGEKPKAEEREEAVMEVEKEKKEIPKQIFVAHGKNRKPLEQLKTILTQFKVPFQVAIDEPHKGRPISAKVAQLMESCTSGVFIFTADEETIDVQGQKAFRPSDNVVFELGAGTILYKEKIVIFREEGVSFGSDFTDFGYINFEKDKLDAKAFELMKELIGLGFLTVTPA